MLSFCYLSTAVLAHSLTEKAFNLLIGFHIATAFFKFNKIFSMRIKSGDLTGHSRTFYVRSLNQALSIFGCILWDECPARKSIDHHLQSLHQGITILAKWPDISRIHDVLHTFMIPLPATVKHPHNKTGPPPCLTMEMVFFCSLALPFLDQTFH